MNDVTEDKSISRYICTANHGFAPYAQEELRRLFGAVKSTLLLPGEIFLATLEEEPEEVAQRLAQNLPVFLRHIQPVDFQDTGDLPALERLAVYLSRVRSCKARRCRCMSAKARPPSGSRVPASCVNGCRAGLTAWTPSSPCRSPLG